MSDIFTKAYIELPYVAFPAERSDAPFRIRQFFADNGFDPVLGAPYAPVNYALTIKSPSANPSQPRLTWTVPSLIVSVEVDLAGANFYIRLANYDGGSLPAGATFELWFLYQSSFGDTVFHLWANSTGNAPGSGQDATAWTATGGQPPYFVWHTTTDSAIAVTCYVKASAGSTVLSSNLVTFSRAGP